MCWNVDWKYRCHLIVDCVSLAILSLNFFLLLVNWHYCSSGEGTDLSCTEHLSHEGTNMVYLFGKHPFYLPTRSTTLFPYQVIRSTNEPRPLEQFLIAYIPPCLQQNRELDFTRGSNRAVRWWEIRRVWSEDDWFDTWTCSGYCRYHVPYKLFKQFWPEDQNYD